MNPEKMEDFHMDLVGNLREHYQESVESDIWLGPKMWRTPKCQFHREDGENPLELWGSHYFLANTYVFFLFNMGWSWLVYECLLSLKKDG
jgi:hypothetical protein